MGSGRDSVHERQRDHLVQRTGDFSYHSITEYSAGLNYYLYGHNAKIQVAYSYLAGESFKDAGFGASRVWLQTQIMF